MKHTVLTCEMLFIYIELIYWLSILIWREDYKTLDVIGV